MLITLYFLEFDDSLNLVDQHETTVATVGDDPAVYVDAIVEFMTDAVALTTIHPWYHRTPDSGEIKDQCFVRSYISRDGGEFKAVVAYYYGYPVQDYHEIDEYYSRNHPPPYLDGYENEYKPRLNVDEFVSWLQNRRAFRQFWADRLAVYSARRNDTHHTDEYYSIPEVETQSGSSTWYVTPSDELHF